MFGIHCEKDRKTLNLDSSGLGNPYSGRRFSVKILKKNKLQILEMFCKFMPVDFEHLSKRRSHWCKRQSIVQLTVFIGARQDANKQHEFFFHSFFCEHESNHELWEYSKTYCSNLKKN